MSPERPMTNRDEELRRMLVATPTAIQPTRRRRTILTPAVAFAVAGALTGGAVSAAALTAGKATTTVSVAEMTEHIVYDDATLFGTPFVLTGRGDTVIELGTAPEGAREVALAFHCVSAGTFRIAIDDVEQGSFSCTDEDTSSTNGGGHHRVDGSGEHTITVSTDASNEFAVWASWANQAALLAPSAEQQAALADGTVTEAEYRAGFDRYRACLDQAGYGLIGIDDSGTVISYSTPGDAVTSGVEGRCYALEFADLDSGWQIANDRRSPAPAFWGMSRVEVRPHVPRLATFRSQEWVLHQEIVQEPPGCFC